MKRAKRGNRWVYVRGLTMYLRGWSFRRRSIANVNADAAWVLWSSRV